MTKKYSDKKIHEALSKIVPVLDELSTQESTKELAKRAGLSIPLTLVVLEQLHSQQHTVKSGAELCYCETDAGSRGGRGVRSSGPAKYIWFVQ